MYVRMYVCMCVRMYICMPRSWPTLCVVSCRRLKNMHVFDLLRRVFQLLSCGIFLPGNLSIPDPCEVSVCVCARVV